MHAIKNKIRSRRGASLTYALLLFLVAAVIGSVVLTAGTAASGRMSQIAEMDQRYYSVNSAARLLIDTITKDKVTVKITTVTTDTSVNTEKKYSVNGATEQALPDNSYPSLTVAAAAKLANNPGSFVPYSPITLTISLKDATGSTIENGPLPVEAKETLLADGSIHLEVYNKTSETSGSDARQYKINVTLSADKQQNRELNITEKSETVTTTLSWKLAEIENVWSLP